MDEQALNKKLAEWAGWSLQDLPAYPKGTTEKRWVDSNNRNHFKYPNFTQSLDACFKWLVPKTVSELADVDLSTIQEAIYKLFDLWVEEIGSEYELGKDALALCLAIEKLIDG